MELEYITAGKIVNTHGIRGEVKILPQGVEPELLAEGYSLYIDGKAYDLTRGRVHKGCLLAKLDGIDDMDAALALKGKTAFLRRDEVPMADGEYFDEELVGLTARNAATGEELGKVAEVMHYPAHDIYVVRGGRDEFLIPAVPEFIASIDLEAETVEIHMMEGLGTHED